MHVLCRIGLHKDRDLWRGPYDPWGQVRHFACLRCGRERRVTFMSPLSGPPTAPMHPDAHKWRPRVQLMFPFVSKMQQKDPALYERIKHLPATTAARVWSETYAEDFPQGHLYVYWPHAAS